MCTVSGTACLGGHRVSVFDSSCRPSKIPGMSAQTVHSEDWIGQVLPENQVNINVDVLGHLCQD